VAIGIRVEQPLDRMAVEQDEPAARHEQSCHDRRPGIEILEPDQ
jgi:hypothetical protein